MNNTNDTKVVALYSEMSETHKLLLRDAEDVRHGWIPNPNFFKQMALSVSGDVFETAKDYKHAESDAGDMVFITVDVVFDELKENLQACQFSHPSSAVIENPDFVLSSVPDMTEAQLILLRICYVAQLYDVDEVCLY